MLCINELPNMPLLLQYIRNVEFIIIRVPRSCCLTTFEQGIEDEVGENGHIERDRYLFLKPLILKFRW